MFCMSSTNLITASTKVQSRRNSSKVKYTVITSLRSCPKEGKKFSHPPESEEATATVWVFPSLRIPRSTFYYTRKFLPCQALSPKNPPERSEGADPEAPPHPRLAPPSGKVPRTPKLHRKGHPKRSTYQSRTTSRVPFAVKFLEFLEPSPKEGSKRGLGRRPKVLVFAPQILPQMASFRWARVRFSRREI